MAEGQVSPTAVGLLQKEPSNEIFALPRQRSRSKDRRESRMFLVDGQICWADDQAGYGGTGKRNSSVGLMFGSSMDLSGVGQSLDSSGGTAGGSGNDEAISYRIKWCRENILQLKRQTWPMEKKLQVLRASKLFIKQHQGELKQSKQAKDVIANTGAIVDRYWRHFKREFANFLVIITPWEMRIKKIESHFGSVVASYFTFLRWIFWLNLANGLVMVSFVMVPELIENVPDFTGLRKGELGRYRAAEYSESAAQEIEFNPTLSELWEFEGFLKFSPIFYGYYGNKEISKSGFWRNPLAYLMSAMLSYLFCFFCISRKLSQNTKMSRIGTKDDEYTFCWTVFVGWDFMIGNSETAYNKTSSLVMNLKEGILEEKEQTKDVDWRLIIRRVFANVLTILLIGASAYVVFLAVQRSENLPEDASLLQKNELQLVMSGIQFMFPPLFDVIGIIEKYHPRTALSWQLGRILFLDFLNFYTLMFSLFGTVDQMGNQLNEVAGNITLLRRNLTYFNNLFTTTTTTTTTTTPSTITTATTIVKSITEVIGGLNETANLTTVAPLNIASFNSSNTTSAVMTLISLVNVTLMPPINVTTSDNNSQVSSFSTNLSILNTTLLNATQIYVEPATTTQNIPPSSSTAPPSTSKLPELITTTISPVVSASSIRSIVISPPVRVAPSTSGPEDEDYPILVEAVKELQPRQRRSAKYELRGDRARRRHLEQDKEYDSHDPKRDQHELEALNSADIRSKKPSERMRTLGVHIPPIRDPYLKPEQQLWPTVTVVSYRDEQSEEEDEEPLEGRMRPAKKRPRIEFADNRPYEVNRVQTSGNPNGDPLAGSTTLDSINTATLISSIGETEDIAKSSRSNADSSSSIEPNGLDYAVLTPRPISLENDAPVKGSRARAKSGLFDPNQQPFVDGQYAVTTCVSLVDYGTSNGELLLSRSSNNSASLEGSTPIGFNASEVNYADCIDIPEFKHQEILALNVTLKDKLKTLCWETMFGQEMMKIVVMDLVMTVVSAVSFEFMRACFVRYCNRFFFWDLERGLPGYQDFKIAENVLHLVNNQSTVWMGMFFAPGLPAINTIKLAILMYVRSWTVLTCNIPHETVFKVSKSNNFYFWILLINLLICILPVAYAVTWIRPSWHCGPFGGECRMYIVVTKLIKSMLPPKASSAFKYLTSPGAVIPILISLVLIIYYLASTVSSSKEANKELKAQLKKDKEQEAAVPEITSTTVDQTPAAPVPVANLVDTTSPTLAATAAKLNPNSLVPSEGSVAASLLAPEVRPKSLLVPPSS